MSQDTSAGRLYELLNSVRRQPPGTSAIDAWRKAVVATTDRELLARLAEVMDLCARVVREVSSLEDEEERELHSLHLDSFRQVSASLVNIGFQQVQHYQGLLPDAVMLNLQHCSLALKRAGIGSPTIEQNARGNLLAHVQDLIKSIADDPDLAPHDKAYLLRLLRDVEWALVGVRIGGFDSLESAAAMLAGSAIAVNAATRETYWKKFIGLAQRILALASGAQAISGAVESGVKAIESVGGLID